MPQHIHLLVQERNEDNTLRIRQIKNQVTLASKDSQFLVNLSNGLTKQRLLDKCMAGLLYCIKI